MTTFDFDPTQHPRDRRGRFLDVVRGLAVGEHVRVKGLSYLHVERKPEGYSVRDAEHTVPQVFPTAEAAARVAIERTMAVQAHIPIARADALKLAEPSPTDDAHTAARKRRLKTVIGRYFDAVDRDDSPTASKHAAQAQALIVDLGLDPRQRPWSERIRRSLRDLRVAWNPDDVLVNETDPSRLEHITRRVGRAINETRTQAARRRMVEASQSGDASGYVAASAELSVLEARQKPKGRTGKTFGQTPADFAAKHPRQARGEFGSKAPLARAASAKQDAGFQGSGPPTPTAALDKLVLHARDKAHAERVKAWLKDQIAKTKPSYHADVVGGSKTDKFFATKIGVGDRNYHSRELVYGKNNRSDEGIGNIGPNPYNEKVRARWVAQHGPK